MGAKTTITEKQFLEMSEVLRDRFIDDNTPGLCKSENGSPVALTPNFTTTWENMGKGISHANENGYEWSAGIIHGLYWCSLRKPGKVLKYASYGESFTSIFLAFWIAYMRALEVISEKSN